MIAALFVVSYLGIVTADVGVEPLDPPALTGLDPVLLGSGTRRPGLDTITAKHGNFHYRFVDVENRSLFESDPERYGIQWGGGCGRMGPLSGRGSPERFAVSEGRIFVFASDGCLASFLKAPATFEWRDVEAPVGDGEARATGIEWYGRFLTASGVMALKGPFARYHEQIEYISKNGDADAARIVEFALSVDGSIRSATSWDASTWAHIRGRLGAFATTPSTPPELLAPSQIRELERIADHHLMSLIFARNRSDLLVIDRGREGGTDPAVRCIEVFFDRQSTILGLDESNGRAVFVRFHGRSGAGRCDRVEDRFSDWREVSGMMLPHRVERTFAGKPVDPGRYVSTTIRVNEEVEDSLFVP